jgi:glycosyltransferase involved in cell wall biosynthesis
MRSKPLFEITIPVLNEAKKLEHCIHQLHQYLSSQFSGQGWRIVIADNGSTDETPILAERLAKRINEISYLRIAKPGVGLALKSSWINSAAEIVGFLDLDLATDLSHIPEAISAIHQEHYDFVYGSRLNKRSTVIGRPFHREVMSRLFNLTLKFMLKTRFSDGFCGFKFFRLTQWSRVDEGGANNDGWFFSPELLIVAEQLNLKIHELPVKWTHGKDSRVRIIKHTTHSLNGILRMKRRKRILSDGA